MMVEQKLNCGVSLNIKEILAGRAPKVIYLEMIGCGAYIPQFKISYTIRHNGLVCFLNGNRSKLKWFTSSPVENPARQIDLAGLTESRKNDKQ